jgi:diacylglycerol kinase (ATP)
MSVAIIINPTAGGNGRAGDRDRHVELAHHVALASGRRADVFFTEHSGHARELAAAARARGAGLVVAWGGDGTINEVASALAFGEVPLAVVPGGSGNGLARALGIASDPAEALRAAFHAEPQAIDVGEIDGRLFVNVAGVGFDAHVASHFNAPENAMRGFAGYAFQTVRGLIEYEASVYEVATPHSRVMVRALFIVLANGAEFGNGVRIAPLARVDDGSLDLVVVEERSRVGTVWEMRRLLSGGLDRAPTWSSRRVQRVTIESAQPMMFHVDGESVQGGTRLEARIHPAALKVCSR